MSEVQDKLQEVLDTVAAEKLEVEASIAALNARILLLEEQINSSQPVTVAQLESLKALVADLHTPTS